MWGVVYCFNLPLLTLVNPLHPSSHPPPTFLPQATSHCLSSPLSPLSFFLSTQSAQFLCSSSSQPLYLIFPPIFSLLPSSLPLSLPPSPPPLSPSLPPSLTLSLDIFQLLITALHTCLKYLYPPHPSLSFPIYICPPLPVLPCPSYNLWP